MEIFREIEPLRAFLRKKRSRRISIGLVPTMGALHEGHLALIRASKAENDLTISSIYVNPTQFTNSTDLDKYPRTLDADISQLKGEGCDILFAPVNAEMYSGSQPIKFDFGGLDKVWEGKYRPGHFSGVALVVSKLFNIIQPDQAYFGQKDYQQFLIINQLTEELKFPIALRSVPIARSPSGLALSSRNQRLTEVDKDKALLLYKSLRYAVGELKNGIAFSIIREEVENRFGKTEGMQLEYFELVDRMTLQPLQNASKLNQGIVLTASYVNGVRLIDNMIFE